jgi:hypothetical protein
MTPRRNAQIAQCCRGCPCKSVADCVGFADNEQVVEYLKETAQCRYCGNHDGLVLVHKVATGEERIACQECLPYMDRLQYTLA